MSITKNYQTAKGNCKVTFSYPSTDGIKSIQVLGDFNNWDSKSAPKMKKGKSEFSVNIDLPVGQAYQFKYLINNAVWENDAQADNYVQSPFGGQHNGVIVIDNGAKSESKVAPKVATSKADTKKAPAKKVAAVKVDTAKKVTAPKTVSVATTKPAATKVEKKVSSKTEKSVSAKATAPKVVKNAAEKVSAPKAEKQVEVKSKVEKPVVAKAKTQKATVKK